MKALSLFTGCGALDLAAEAAGIIVVGQCEIDDACNRVLDYWWPEVQRWKDVQDVTAEQIQDKIGEVDVIFGGPPCQPISVAGRRKAAGDKRNMWPEFIRLIRGTRPRWVVAENPPGIISAQKFKDDETKWPKGEFFGEIVREIAALGYRVGWGVWGACDVGAPHQRERVFIVAYNHSDRRESRRTEQPGEQRRRETSIGGTRQLANADGDGEQQPCRDIPECRRWLVDGGEPLADAASADRECAVYTRGRRLRPTDSGVMEDTRGGGRGQARCICNIQSVQSEDRQGWTDQSVASSEIPGTMGDAEYDGLLTLPKLRGYEAAGQERGKEEQESSEQPSRANRPTYVPSVCRCKSGGQPGGAGGADDTMTHAYNEGSGTSADGADRERQACAGEREDELRRRACGHGEDVEYANRKRCEELDTATVANGSGFCGRECSYGNMGYSDSIGSQQQQMRFRPQPEDGCVCEGYGLEPGMGGIAYGSAAGMDFTSWPWPAGRGPEQYPWEPPRAVPSGLVPERAARIKMLGNAVVPQQALILFEAICAADAEYTNQGKNYD